jgi:hypothetical protein
MEPNPSNDRVMLQGDGLFFWNEISSFCLTVQYISIYTSKYQSIWLLGCRKPRVLEVHQLRSYITARLQQQLTTTTKKT